MNIFVNIVKQNNSGAMFSLEMSKEQVANRILAIESLVPIEKIRNQKMDYIEWKKAARALKDIGKYNLYIDDTTDITITEIEEKCRKQKDLKVVFIDYSQLINCENSIEEISTRLKQLAEELKIIIIVSSELSREIEQREDKRPRLTDLKESKSLIEKADTLMLLYRDGYYTKKTAMQNMLDVHVINNKKNIDEVVKCVWINECLKVM